MSHDTDFCKATMKVGQPMVGLDYSSITHMSHILELASRIGHQPLTLLVDVGSIGNYIDARECMARKLLAEIEDQSGKPYMRDVISS